MKLTILHTNDLHGHLAPWQGWEGDLKGRTIGGLGVLASAIGAARSEARRECLLLDAGGLIRDTMSADLTKGKALIAALNYLRYDALTIEVLPPRSTAFSMRSLSEHSSAERPCDRLKALASFAKRTTNNLAA